MTTFNRYIALGDSMTEGMCDEMIGGQYRGWADRTAEVLAELSADFTYFNLAVRGKLLGQVIAEQIPVAKQFVEGKQTLVSFHAGGNDVLRPNYKPETTLALYEKGARELASTGATLMLFTVVEKATGNGKTAELWERRFSEFNNRVRKVAAELDAILFEWSVAPFLADRRFLAPDRLHLNEAGHERVAHGVLEALGAPFDTNWKVPLPPAPKVAKSAELVADIHWFVDFALPWIWRRIRGKSSGDGRTAKHQNPMSPS